MREILFRGKSNWAYGNVKVGDWLYGMTISRHCYNDEEITSYYIGGGNNTIDGKTLGQFTGIIDKNGNKIFEGDIVHCLSNTDCGNCVVIFEEGEFRLVPDRYYKTYTTGGGYHAIRCFIKEVVGNIHDKPELLRTPQNDEVRE